MASRSKPPAAPKRTAKAPARKAAPAQGPLTVAQARAIAHAQQPAPLVAKAARAAGAAKAGARRRAPTRALPVIAPTPTPDTVEVEKRRLSKQQRQDIRQRVRDYKATMALLEKRGVKGLTSAAAAAPAKRRSSKAAPPGGAAPAASAGPLRVLAEGDSWFDYPSFYGGGLVPRLEDCLGVPILSLAKAGDETRYMLGVKERKLLAQHLRDGSPNGGAWELLLFSGGGNDIVDEPMVLWLHDFDPSKPAHLLLNQPRFASALELVRAAYEDLIKLRDALSPGTHLAFHGYDFPIADGRKICHLGPWLKPSFDARGFPPDGVASGAVLKAMLQAFAAMLLTLTRNNVSFIQTQDTLKRERASWHNEMHPSRGGFDQIADVMHKALAPHFPGRVLP